MGPFTGPWNGRAGVEGPVRQDGTTFWPGESGEFGSRAGWSFTFGADQVADARGERDVVKVGKVEDGNSGAMNTRVCQLFTQGVNLFKVIIKGRHVELALRGDGLGKRAIGESHNDSEPGLSRKILEIGFGKGVVTIRSRSWHVIHASVKLVEGAKFFAVFSFGADPVGIAGV